MSVEAVAETDGENLIDVDFGADLANDRVPRLHSDDSRVLRVAEVDIRFAGLTEAEFSAMTQASEMVRVAKGRIRTRTHREAIVVPWQRSAAGAHEGVVLDQNRVLDTYSVRKCTGKVELDQSPAEMPRREGTYLFAGQLIHHYGHFLLESLARLWALKDSKVDGIVFVTVYNGDAPRFICDTIRLLFGDIKVFIDRKPTVYETLIVPDRTLKMRGPVAAGFLDLFAACSIEPAPNVGKIYLSRGKLKLQRDRNFRFGEKCVVGESFVEETLARNGVRIVYPEQETVESQIALVRGAEAICALQGSALHNIVYAEDKDMFVLCRQKGFWKPAHLIDAVRSGRSTYIWPEDLDHSGLLVPPIPGTSERLYPRIIDPATALGRLSRAGFVNNLSSEDYLDARAVAIAEYNLRMLCAIMDIGIDARDDTVVDRVKALAERYAVASAQPFLDEANAFFASVPPKRRTARLWRDTVTVV